MNSTDSANSTYRTVVSPNVDKYKINAIRVFLLESERKIRVRICPTGYEQDYHLDNNSIGLRIIDGNLEIGEGVMLNCPYKFPEDIRIYEPYVQGFFSHRIDPNADETPMLLEANDIAFIGAGDDRDECDLVGPGRPKHMFFFQLSLATIRLKIVTSAMGDLLEIWNEEGLQNGLEHWVTTNLNPVN